MNKVSVAWMVSVSLVVSAQLAHAKTEERVSCSAALSLRMQKIVQERRETRTTAVSEIRAFKVEVSDAGVTQVESILADFGRVAVRYRKGQLSEPELLRANHQTQRDLGIIIRKEIVANGSVFRAPAPSMGMSRNTIERILAREFPARERLQLAMLVEAGGLGLLQNQNLMPEIFHAQSAFDEHHDAHIAYQIALRERAEDFKHIAPDQARQTVQRLKVEKSKLASRLTAPRERAAVLEQSDQDRLDEVESDLAALALMGVD